MGASKLKRNTLPTVAADKTAMPSVSKPVETSLKRVSIAEMSDKTRADLALRPSFNAAIAVHSIPNRTGEIDAGALMGSLNLMKNAPSVMFVKQANVANGPQQVNNGSRAKETENQPNELLAQEQRNGSAQVDLEQRHRQSALIRTWRPWERSSGPRTPAGKACASRNSFKGGVRPQIRQMARVLGEQRKFIRHLGSSLQS